MRHVENSPEYYRRREAQERELAAKAEDKHIQQIHLSMAEKYAQLADDLSKNLWRKKP